MAQGLETKIVRWMEKLFTANQIYYVNIHGSFLGNQNGIPDFIVTDKTGIFSGIEVKQPGGHITAAQCRQAQEILKNGGRFVVAVNDFNLDKFLNHELKTKTITVDTDDMEMFDRFNPVKETFEIILDNEGKTE